MRVRNNRASGLIRFAITNRLHKVNTFFQEDKKRKWAWQGSGGVTLIQTDCMLTSTKRLFIDVPAIGGEIAWTGYDHHLLNSKIRIDYKCEKNTLMSKGILKVDLEY